MHSYRLCWLKSNEVGLQSCLYADVSVELAVCCLLLGNSIAAEDALKLGPGSNSLEADPAVCAYVLVGCACWILMPATCGAAHISTGSFHLHPDYQVSLLLCVPMIMVSHTTDSACLPAGLRQLLMSSPQLHCVSPACCTLCLTSCML